MQERWRAVVGGVAILVACEDGAMGFGIDCLKIALDSVQAGNCWEKLKFHCASISIFQPIEGIRYLSKFKFDKKTTNFFCMPTKSIGNLEQASRWQWI